MLPSFKLMQGLKEKSLSPETIVIWMFENKSLTLQLITNDLAMSSNTTSPISIILSLSFSICNSRVSTMIQIFSQRDIINYNYSNSV